LDLFNRASFQTVTVDSKMLAVWSDSPLWVFFGVTSIIWLMVWRKPPKVIWGLWLSTSVLAGWGLINLMFGLSASHPVSLLGPTIILFVAAPLAWTTADSLQERVQQEAEGQGQMDTAIRHREGG
ncbi:MAG: hypothetical protein LC650_04260, partial [Actinobacteria bacterium]|nr:hypothetical protein [Actinomycetota bacterium]